MGEEQNKPVEPKKPEEEEKDKKKEEEDEAKPTEEKKPEEPKTEAASPPPPPPEILLRVFMHCEGCARKVRRSLKGFPGVEDVITDCKSHKVVVKGEKADPLKVLERVQRKSHRKTELLSPIPKPEEKTPSEEEKPKPEEKKEEPQFVTVVLKVHMHCEACAQEIKRRIQRMKGVESAEPDFKNSQVSVKGVYDPAKLVEYVYKRSGKQALILKQEPEPAKEEKTEEAKEEKKDEEENKEKKTEAEEKNKEEEKKNQETEGDTKPEDETAIEETNIAEVKKNEYYYYPPRSGMEICAYPTYPSYPPQIFSDENPNACSVM